MKMSDRITNFRKPLIPLLWLFWSCCLTGCVTEVSGGLPKPAPQGERVEAQLDLARGYLARRDFDRARGPLERALEIDPDHVEALVLSAVFYQAEKEYELTERYYRRALSIEPDNAQALNNYGSFLYARKRYEDAVVPLSELVKDTSYRARGQAFENLGLALLRVNDVQAAEDAFNRSIDLGLRQPQSSLELAHIAFERQDYPIASRRLTEYKTYASRPSARGLCLELKLATATGDSNRMASASLALNNLYPKQAAQCQPTN